MRTLYILLLTVLLSACVDASNHGLQYSRNSPQRGLVKNTLADPNAPVMIRIIKETATLELWKQSGSSWKQIKTYPICKFSGDIGPKKRVGDRQAPEGFYEITRYQLNPFSREYLSINTGYPNARDRAHGYSGDALMIHGGCASIGCYAVEDKAMEEIYAVVRDSLLAGQDRVQLQIYPFPMTAWRMAMMSNHKDYEFWKELKQGWDWFEDNRSPIPVTVEGKRYRIAN